MNTIYRDLVKSYSNMPLDNMNLATDSCPVPTYIKQRGPKFFSPSQPRNTQPPPSMCKLVRSTANKGSKEQSVPGWSGLRSWSPERQLACRAVPFIIPLTSQYMTLYKNENLGPCFSHYGGILL